MNPLVLLLFFVSMFSCNSNEKKSGTKEAPTTDTPVSSRRPLYSIPKEDIIVEWKNPRVIVYKKDDGCRYHCAYVQFDHELGSCDTVLFGDGMIAVDSVHIDTLRLGDGKYPEFVFKWYASGSHSYGPNHGGWAMNTIGIDIWDINTFTSLFSTNVYEYSTESTREYTGDENSEKDNGEYNFNISRHDEKTTVQLDTAHKIITLSFEYNDSVSRKPERYLYRPGGFVLVK